MSATRAPIASSMLQPSAIPCKKSIYPYCVQDYILRCIMTTKAKAGKGSEVRAYSFTADGRSDHFSSCIGSHTKIVAPAAVAKLHTRAYKHKKNVTAVESHGKGDGGTNPEASKWPTQTISHIFIAVYHIYGPPLRHRQGFSNFIIIILGFNPGLGCLYCTRLLYRLSFSLFVNAL